jgi:hypothetical protein
MAGDLDGGSDLHGSFTEDRHIRIFWWGRHSCLP